MDFSTDLGQTTKLGARLTVLAMAVALSACGGGGASDAVKPVSNGGPTTVQKIANLTTVFEFSDEVKVFSINGSRLKIDVRVLDLSTSSSVAGRAVSLGFTNAIAKGVSVIGSHTGFTNEEGVASFELILQPSTAANRADLLNNGIDISAVATDAAGRFSIPQVQRIAVRDTSSGEVEQNLNLSLKTTRPSLQVTGGVFTLSAVVTNDIGGSIEGQEVQLAIPNAITKGVRILGSSSVMTNNLGVADFQIQFEPTATTDLNALLASGIVMGASLVKIVPAVSQAFTMPVVTAASSDLGILVTQSSPSILTGGGNSTLSFRVTDALGGVIAGQQVRLEILNRNLAGATFTTGSVITTDEQGLATTTLEVDAGTTKLDYKFDRDVVVRATILDTQGRALGSQDVTIPVTGTQVNVTANQTVVRVGEPVTVTVNVRDGRNSPIVNSRIQLLDGAGNAIAHSPINSNTEGRAVIVLGANLLTPSANGEVSITARASGTTTGVQQESVTPLVLGTSTQDFSFVDATTAFTVENPAEVTLQVRGATAAEVVGKTIELLTTKGTLDVQRKTVTNATSIATPSGNVFVGEVTFLLTSKSPGLANLAARLGTTRITSQVNFISTTPTKFIVQPEEATLSVSGSTRVRAIVKDAQDAPVEGQRVLFTTVADASGGVLSSPDAITNAAGVAEIGYTAGTASTALDGVKLQATLDGIDTAQLTVNHNAVSLTVAQQAAFITLSVADKLTVSGREVFYKLPVAATVVDIAGRPIANQVVSLSLTPSFYSKGRFFVANSVVDGAVISVRAQDGFECISEDSNKNGILDRGEDISQDGELTPRNPVAIIASSGQQVGSTSAQFLTDAEGNFSFDIQYGKQYSEWLKIDLRASTLVSGTEYFHKESRLLPVAANDVRIESGRLIAPNVLSPYGQGTVTINDPVRGVLNPCQYAQ